MTIALGMARPNAAAMPWTRRVTTSTSTNGAKMQTTAEAVNTTRSGEQGRPPAAPVADRAGDQLAEPEPDEERRDAEGHRGLGRSRDSAAAGIAGRKRSVANDPRLQSPPKRRMMAALPPGGEVVERRVHDHGAQQTVMSAQVPGSSSQARVPASVEPRADGEQSPGRAGLLRR